MKKLFKNSIITFLLGIILSTVIYFLSPLKKGNQADIIELTGMLIFFSVIFVSSLIINLVLHFIFNFEGKIIFLIVNGFILVLILFNHSMPWKNLYLLICMPIYFLIQYLLIVIENKKTSE